MCRDGGEDIAPMKCLTYRFQKIFLRCDPPDLVLLARVNHGENAVIRRDETLPGGFHQNGPARRAHSGIDDHHVHRAARKIAVRLRDQECAFGERERAHFVGDVDDFGVGTDAQNDAFHHAGKVVRKAEIRGQSNNGAAHC